MLIKIPTTFADAVGYADERGLLPTTMSSAEIRRDLAPHVRRQSILSARVNNARYLQAVKDVVEDVVTGRINQARAREILLDMLDDIGYSAEGGFDETPGVVPEASPDSLQDLRSRARLDLIIDTQVQMALNRGFVERYKRAPRRYVVPAWELVRLFARDTPRGYRRDGDGMMVPVPDDDWPSRWRIAGGQFYGGRMIARVDDPVWQRIGSSELFDDALDNPYPPFAFRSGYGLREVARESAEALGVIRPGDVPGPPVIDIDAQVVMETASREASPATRGNAPDKPSAPSVQPKPTVPPKPKLDPQIERELDKSIKRDLPGDWEAFLEDAYKTA